MINSKPHQESAQHNSYTNNSSYFGRITFSEPDFEQNRYEMNHQAAKA